MASWRIVLVPYDLHNGALSAHLHLWLWMAIWRSTFTLIFLCFSVYLSNFFNGENKPKDAFPQNKYPIRLNKAMEKQLGREYATYINREFRRVNFGHLCLFNIENRSRVFKKKRTPIFILLLVCNLCFLLWGQCSCSPQGHNRPVSTTLLVEPFNK